MTVASPDAWACVLQGLCGSGVCLLELSWGCGTDYHARQISTATNCSCSPSVDLGPSTLDRNRRNVQVSWTRSRIVYCDYSTRYVDLDLCCERRSGPIDRTIVSADATNLDIVLLPFDRDRCGLSVVLRCPSFSNEFESGRREHNAGRHVSNSSISIAWHRDRVGPLPQQSGRIGVDGGCRNDLATLDNRTHQRNGCRRDASVVDISRPTGSGDSARRSLRQCWASSGGSSTCCSAHPVIVWLSVAADSVTAQRLRRLSRFRRATY